MPSVIFQHPSGEGDLVVHTGADQISWGYGLNTQSFPTYGGEVVQILSAYIDDLQIQGTCRNYAEAERIYTWFLKYFQRASQSGGFQETPVTFLYPERGWTLSVQPKTLPGFRLATEVVAPTWQITCSVVEQDAKLSDQVLQFISAEGTDEFKRLNAGIGYDDNNPFSRFDVKDESKGKKGKKGTKDFDHTTTKEALDKVGDWFAKLIPSYLDGDFKSTQADLIGSGPADSSQKGKGGKQTPAAKQKTKLKDAHGKTFTKDRRKANG